MAVPSSSMMTGTVSAPAGTPTGRPGRADSTTAEVDGAGGARRRTRGAPAQMRPAHAANASTHSARDRIGPPRVKYHFLVEKVTPTIDGRPVSVPKGTTVLQAAIEAGSRFPSTAITPVWASRVVPCRLVKIEKFPKLQTSCSTPVAEGMVVHTKDGESVEGRAGCSSSCSSTTRSTARCATRAASARCRTSLQVGNAESRMDFPRRTFDGEGVKADVDFGPTLMLNRNRCIMCTRCERFMREVDGDAQIGVINRGNGSEIATFNDQGIHSLLSGNLMDVCPVGAITTKQYRFRSRPWDNPHAVDTTCTLCSKGCSTTAWLKAKPEWAKGSRLVRITPRYNPAVNDFWMCDIGRFQHCGSRATTASAGRCCWPGRRAAVGDVEGRAGQDPRSLDAAGRKDASSVRMLARRTPRTRSCSS